MLQNCLYIGMEFTIITMNLKRNVKTDGLKAILTSTRKLWAACYYHC